MAGKEEEGKGGGEERRVKSKLEERADEKRRKHETSKHQLLIVVKRCSYLELATHIVSIDSRVLYYVSTYVQYIARSVVKTNLSARCHN